MIVAIVQARVGSTRLPGKVLRDLHGMPILGHVLTRAKAIPRVEAVCCAIPDSRENDMVSEIASGFGAKVVRGPEQDVLTRYLLAAQACSASVIMRVTSDCPLLDPVVSGEVLAAFLERGVDYVSNVDPRSWPRGLDTEVFSRSVLVRMALEASDTGDREHVTPWLRRTSGIRRLNVAQPDARYASWRWTLDYPEDLAFAQAILAGLPPPPYMPGFQELRRVIEARPAIGSINSHLT